VTEAVLARAAWAPDHVPEELLWDHDIRDFVRGHDDPYVALAQLHEGPGIIWARGIARDRPGWAPVSYDCIVDVLQDPATFSSAYATGFSQMMGVDWRLNPLDFDPPEHAAYRRILQPWFQPSAIARLEGSIRAVARELIQGFANHGECEFIKAFACEFPTRIFMEMMGFPKDQAPRFLELEHALLRSATLEARASAGFAIVDFLRGHLDERRSNPRDDLPSAILAGKIDGRPLNDDETIGMAMLLYIAGLDTVLSSSGWHMRYLASHPELQSRLRDHPEEIPAAVDDLLRAHGVLHSFRTVTRDVTFHGVEMKQGDNLVIATWLPSRDPVQFPDPHVVRSTNRPRHLTFSSGPHNCMGVHLARRELIIVIEEFLAHFDDIRIAPGRSAAWEVEGSAWSVTDLPLAFRKRAG